MTKRKELKIGLSKCTLEQQRLFIRMYCNDLLDKNIDISEIIKRVKPKDLNWSLTQVNYALKKNNEPIIEKVVEKIEIPTDEIWDVAVEKGRELSCELMNEPHERNVVGGEVEDEIEYNGLKYKIIVNTFWEKSIYYDLTVIGENYHKHENCIDL